MILEVGLLPFINENFSDGHRLFHENYPKHTSEHIEAFLNVIMCISGLPPREPRS